MGFERCIEESKNLNDKHRENDRQDRSGGTIDQKYQTFDFALTHKKTKDDKSPFTKSKDG